jgi:histone H3/H4
MKSNLDLPLVQNDAAILVTQATELFIKKLAKDSSEISAKKGRGTIKYDDLAEARAKNKAFSFLDLLIP